MSFLPIICANDLTILFCSVDHSQMKTNSVTQHLKHCGTNRLDNLHQFLCTVPTAKFNLRSMKSFKQNTVAIKTTFFDTKKKQNVSGAKCIFSHSAILLPYVHTKLNIISVYTSTTMSHLFYVQTTKDLKVQLDDLFWQNRSVNTYIKEFVICGR
jgi:hypothetical protein